VLRLAVRVRREQAEVVLAELLELAPSGVEEVEVGAGLIEYAVYGAPGELPALPDLTAAAGDALVEVHTEEIADDWERRWRGFHKPLVLGDRLAVRPPWEEPLGTAIDLVIDPGRAFGTGAHATTRLCLALMLELAEADSEHRPGASPHGPLLDLGCGSGVLAIAAARLGWGPVVAVDNDPAAVEAAAENARVNGVEIEVRRHDLRTDPVVCAATVAANLLRPLLLAWAERLARPAGAGGDAPGDGRDPPDRLIASGLLAGEIDEVATAFAPTGLAEAGRRVSGEWAALLLERQGARAVTNERSGAP
jgi:ribosomal protein L11 methyltransferase